jgi:hypothetical protein
LPLIPHIILKNCHRLHKWISIKAAHYEPDKNNADNYKTLIDVIITKASDIKITESEVIHLGISDILRQ